MELFPRIIKGGRHKDERGTLKYFNELNLDEVRRFYISEHPDTSVIRAWQGHKRESKWFHVIAGAFKVILVKPDNWDTPSLDLTNQLFELTSKTNEVLYIPGGYATGFQALIPNSSLMIFSDFSLEESMEDDFRFGKDLWYKW